jgi:hypothetical protein
MKKSNSLTLAFMAYCLTGYASAQEPTAIDGDYLSPKLTEQLPVASLIPTQISSGQASYVTRSDNDTDDALLRNCSRFSCA